MVSTVPPPPKLVPAKGLASLPNGDVTLRRGVLKNPFSTLTRAGGREWRVRSVEDVVDAEGGDYGFLEYYSLRRTSSRDTALTDPRPGLTYGTWSHLNGTWSRCWADPSPAQFYPGTLTRGGDKADRKRGSNGDQRPRSYHIDDHWRSEDIRTSTPLSTATSSLHDLPTPSIAHHPQHQVRPTENGGDTARRGIAKRNSLLWRLRPDRWRTLDGSLRRARSRDDGLDTTRGRRKGDLGASQPDLLTSHRAPGEPDQCDLVPPAPLSILPPTTRRAALSETLPRRSRHSSKDSSTSTLLARGRRWLHGASLGRADRVTEREESELMVQPETLPSHQLTSNNNMHNSTSRNNHKNHLNSLSMGGPPVFGSLGREGGELGDIRRRGRTRSRRPRTFYLLEDYLSPVRAAGGAPPAGVVLDEYVGHTPRLVFREGPNEVPQRPLPPTPEWDTPSLSPPSSVMNGHHPTPLQHLLHTSHHHPVGGGGGGHSIFVDAIIPSPEKSGGSSVYSPVFSPRDSGYPRFVTPELALPELSIPDRAPQHMNGSGPPPPTHALYTHTHSYRSLEREERRRAKESRKV